MGCAEEVEVAQGLSCRCRAITLGDSQALIELPSTGPPPIPVDPLIRGWELDVRILLRALRDGLTQRIAQSVGGRPGGDVDVPGWVLHHDGVRRAMSRTRSSSSRGIGCGRKARQLHRVDNNLSSASVATSSADMSDAAATPTGSAVMTAPSFCRTSSSEISPPHAGNGAGGHTLHTCGHTVSVDIVFTTVYPEL